MQKFDALRAIQLIHQYEIDWVLFVPTMMQRIWKLSADVKSSYPLNSLRIIMCTGAPTPSWLKQAWIDWLGAEKIFEAYGGSERIGATEISGTEWLNHKGSVGRPVNGTQVVIIDTAGNVLPHGEVGEVYLLPKTGTQSTFSYIGAAPKLHDGFQSLGDLGYLDKEGYLYLVDRLTDMIVSGGANIYPAEVEAAIDAFPNVRSSAVIGLPDEDLGQRVHAIVDVMSPVAENSLIEHVQNYLVRFKIPRSFEFVTEPLRDDAGKVRRYQLREMRIGLLKKALQ
jgi:bile acid-coenzyme A ligase